MTLTTRFKNLGNILAQDETQTDVYVLASPVLTNGMYERMIARTRRCGGGHRLHVRRARRARKTPGPRCATRSTASARRRKTAVLRAAATSC